MAERWGFAVPLRCSCVARMALSTDCEPQNRRSASCRWHCCVHRHRRGVQRVQARLAHPALGKSRDVHTPSCPCAYRDPDIRGFAARPAMGVWGLATTGRCRTRNRAHRCRQGRRRSSGASSPASRGRCRLRWPRNRVGCTCRAGVGGQRRPALARHRRDARREGRLRWSAASRRIAPLRPRGLRSPI